MEAEVIYQISEVTEMTGIKESTLRYWEREFKGYISVSRDKYGSRAYKQGDIDKLRAINLMRKEGLTLAKIKATLDRLQEEASSAMGAVAITKEMEAPLPPVVPPEVMQVFSDEIRKIIREELELMIRPKSKWWKWWG